MRTTKPSAKNPLVARIRQNLIRRCPFGPQVLSIVYITAPLHMLGGLRIFRPTFADTLGRMVYELRLRLRKAFQAKRREIKRRCDAQRTLRERFSYGW
jgi:hypothetical protein